MSEPRNIRQNTTLKDIAAATGYSINTISRALRDKDDISPETKKRIRSVAEEMGHINNSLASSLRLGYTNTIAVILGDISNPHFSIMMKTIEEYARLEGYSTILLNTNEDEEQEFKAIQSALNKNVDGIILCPTQKSKKSIQYLQSVNIPFVLIGRRFSDIDTNYVVCNDELGGYQATNLLLKNGHKKILFLNGPDYISSSKERLAGYRRACSEFGLPVDDRLICDVDITLTDSNELLRSLSQLKTDFSAIFAFSDLLAWSAWKCLRESGKNIPKDCSLVGFDHIQSQFPLPYKLTSVKSYKRRLSTEAAKLLIRKIHDAGSPNEHIIIDTAIAPGETVQPFLL